MREDGQAVDDALYSLAMGPDTRVRHYESCVVGDVRYNTLARDEGRKTQNSAIMSTYTYDKETTEMYANITDIVQLQYISSFEDHRCVVLLCCRWYNLFSRIAKPKADDHQCQGGVPDQRAFYFGKSSNTNIFLGSHICT